MYDIARQAKLTGCVFEPGNFGETIGPAVIDARVITNPYSVELGFSGSLSFRSGR